MHSTRATVSVRTAPHCGTSVKNETSPTASPSPKRLAIDSEGTLNGLVAWAWAWALATVGESPASGLSLAGPGSAPPWSELSAERGIAAPDPGAAGQPLPPASTAGEPPGPPKKASPPRSEES